MPAGAGPFGAAGPPEWCATGGSDARVKIWDLSSLGSGAEPAVQERAGHSGSVQVLAASPVCARSPTQALTVRAPHPKK